MLPIHKIIFWRKIFYSCNIVLRKLAKGCRKNVFATADMYKMSISEVLHVYRSALKSLF